MKYLILFTFTILMVTKTSYAGPYDGSYSGTRFVGKNALSPEKCNPTSITGSIKGSSVTLTLTYNDATLKGKVDRSGRLKLRGETPNGTYLYKFSGRARGKKIKGTWSTSPRDCEGTWSIQKK